MSYSHRTISQADLSDDDVLRTAMIWFMWIMKRACGAKGWGDKVQHTTTISNATCSWDRKKPYLFHNDESYALVLYENTEVRIRKQFEWQRTHPGQKLPAWSKENELVPAMAGLHKGKYSKQDGGKQALGVFSEEGVKRFNGLTKAYMAAKFVDPAKAGKNEDMRMKPAWVAWEQEYLGRMKAHLNIPDEVPGGLARGRKRDEEPKEPQELPMEFAD